MYDTRPGRSRAARQVAHGLSIAETLRRDLAPAWRPVAARHAARDGGAGARRAASTALLHVAATLEGPVVSVLCLVARGRPRDGGGGGGAAGAQRALAPVYGAHVVGLLGAATYSVRGAAMAAAEMAQVPVLVLVSGAPVRALAWP